MKWLGNSNIITTRDSSSLRSLLHNTSSSETNTDNIFLWENRTVANSNARYHLAGNILDEGRAKKYVWQAQSQNNSRKQQPDN